ncbi:MAG: formate/nitrite transporter family protein [Dehalococcoidia bacterium]|nr:formate/nitrite transporter family protein [Dehalococcoidia bacterium]
MTGDTVEAVAGAAAKKARYLRESPSGYFILSALAGAYVGFGIILIFAIGAPLSAAGSPFTKVVMGASFGIALSLVIFAGSELFTGNNMVMMIGALKRTSSPVALGSVWALSFLGNLAGSLLLAWLVAKSGVLGGAPQLGFVQKTVETKMHLPASELFVRGILCNWLVCLAVWSAMRAQTEMARLVMIFWCLFAFIGAGFEHSVANMTLLAVGLFQEHGAAITWGGFVHNLAPVTLGNIVGGAAFVGGAYWFSNLPLRLGRVEVPARQPEATMAEA